MKIGYIRISTDETKQSIDRQVDILKDKYGVEDKWLFTDTTSGKHTDRPALKKMLEILREGDIVHIVSIDRLSRSTMDFLKLMEIFEEKGVDVVCDREPIDTTTPTGKAIATVLMAMKQLERETIVENVRQGIASAKARGIHCGRPRIEYPKNWEKTIKLLDEGTIKSVDAMKLLGLKKTSYYKLLKQFKTNQ